MPPDLSIIIPSRDRLWSLPKAVESCRSQKVKVQIIVIDDSSKDGTWDWLKSQPDVEAVAGEGWGKPWGVNKALALATGKYLRYLDSDDWLNPGANGMQFEIAEREQAEVVVAGLDIYQDALGAHELGVPALAGWDAPGSSTDAISRDAGCAAVPPAKAGTPNPALQERCPWVPTDDFIAQQLGETPYSHYSAFLFRREFVKDIPHRTLFPASDFASRDDRCFMLEVALRHPKIAVCGTPTLCHRHHGQGRLQFQGGFRGDGTNLQHFYIYKQVLTLLEERGELTQRRKKAAALIIWLLAHWIGYSHLEEACEAAEWVHRLDPQFSVPESGLLGALYRRLGFRSTERLLRMRRALLAPFRRQPQRKRPQWPI